MSDLTFEVAVKLLRADFVAGKLFWLPRQPDMFSRVQPWKTWNTRYAGAEAFVSPDMQGYLQGRVNGRRYQAHRVIWLLAWGVWPDGEIDHVNGIRSDNRLSNLREASHAENQRNQKMPSTNTSGVVGVCWHLATGKWRAQIRKNGVTKHLGYFDEFEAAVARRKAAEIEEGFHQNHGRAA